VEFHSRHISQVIDILVKMDYQCQNQLLIFQKVDSLGRVIEKQDVWSLVKQDDLILAHSKVLNMSQD